VVVDAGDVGITAGQAVSFAGSASDPDGDPVTVTWSFGDGGSSASLSPGSHSYAAAGTYTVTFTATDSRGLADPTPDRRTITVTVPSVTLTTLQSTIFTPTCSGCHGRNGDAGMDLRAGQSYFNLVNVRATSQSGTRVIPGDPSNSVLGKKLAAGHRSRPAAEQQQIRNWILAGAQNN
jgi:PKD repeat protein